MAFCAPVAYLRFEVVLRSLFLQTSFGSFLGFVEFLAVLVDESVHVEDNVSLDHSTFLLVGLSWTFE